MRIVLNVEAHKLKRAVDVLQSVDKHKIAFI